MFGITPAFCLEIKKSAQSDFANISTLEDLDGPLRSGAEPVLYSELESPKSDDDELVELVEVEELALLLSQRPTLYYEPLSNVFEALRQDETINSISELMDGEMIIEAYDLDLRITEVCRRSRLSLVPRLTSRLG